MDSFIFHGLHGLRVTRLEPAEVSGWWLAFRAADAAVFAAAHAAVRALPSDERLWVIGARAWWISEPALEELAERLPALRRALADRRRGATSEDGSGSAQQSGGGSERRARQSRSRPYEADTYQGVPAAVAESFAELHLLSGAPPELVMASYRIGAKRAHPDVGGSHEAMKRVNAAYQAALVWAERQDTSSLSEAGMGNGR